MLPPREGGEGELPSLRASHWRAVRKRLGNAEGARQSLRSQTPWPTLRTLLRGDSKQTALRLRKASYFEIWLLSRDCIGMLIICVLSVSAMTFSVQTSDGSMTPFRQTIQFAQAFEAAFGIMYTLLLGSFMTTLRITLSRLVDSDPGSLLEVIKRPSKADIGSFFLFFVFSVGRLIFLSVTKKEPLSVFLCVKGVFGVVWLGAIIWTTFVMRPTMIQRERLRLIEHLRVWFTRFRLVVSLQILGTCYVGLVALSIPPTVNVEPKGRGGWTDWSICDPQGTTDCACKLVNESYLTKYCQRV